MRVLVTGATGFVGSAVVRELLGHGHAVRALLRPTSPDDNLRSLPVERAEGDVLDRASVRRALRGCDGVVHTAGVVHLRPGDRAALLAVNARGVELVLGAALEAGVRRAVHTSSIAVLGGTDRPRLLDEDAPSNAAQLGIDYFVSKLEGERAALDLARRGLPVVVVRPSFVLGPGDVHRSSAGVVLAIARRRYRLYVRGGVSCCDVRDVAAAHVEALVRGRVGETYVLGGHNVEVEAFARAVARLAGVPAPRRVPYAVAYGAAAAAEVMARARGKRPHLTRQLVRSSHLYTFASSAKAARELSYTMRPLETSVADTLRWFLSRGMLSPETPELAALTAAPGFT
jgi:dihydroflavonol-4-reductase